jgi:hypothetical protein
VSGYVKCGSDALSVQAALGGIVVREGSPRHDEALGTWSPAPYLNVAAVDREEARWLAGNDIWPGARVLSGLWRAIAFVPKHLLTHAGRSFRTWDVSYDPGARGSLALPEQTMRPPDCMLCVGPGDEKGGPGSFRWTRSFLLRSTTAFAN